MILKSNNLLRIRSLILVAIVMISLASIAPVHAETTGVAVGQKMSDFVGEDQTGKTRTFDKLRGEAPALVYFYSGCCGHCSKMLKTFSPWEREIRDQKIAVVGVQYYGNSETCLLKAKEFDLVGTNLADHDGKICAKFGVGDFTVFAVDANGVIQYRGVGDDRQAVRKALGK